MRITAIPYGVKYVCATKGKQTMPYSIVAITFLTKKCSTSRKTTQVRLSVLGGTAVPEAAELRPKLPGRSTPRGYSRK